MITGTRVTHVRMFRSINHGLREGERIPTEDAHVPILIFPSFDHYTNLFRVTRTTYILSIKHAAIRTCSAMFLTAAKRNAAPRLLRSR